MNVRSACRSDWPVNILHSLIQSSPTEGSGSLMNEWFLSTITEGFLVPLSGFPVNIFLHKIDKLKLFLCLCPCSGCFKSMWGTQKKKTMLRVAWRKGALGARRAACVWPAEPWKQRRKKDRRVSIETQESSAESVLRDTRREDKPHDPSLPDSHLFNEKHSNITQSFTRHSFRIM